MSEQRTDKLEVSIKELQNNNSQQSNEISLKDLFDVVWNGKFLILIMAAIFTIIGGAGAMIYDTATSEVTTIVTMQWTGIASGEYPDGTQFNYSDAIEPYSITQAIDNEGLDLLTNDVVQALTIRPIVPNDVTSIVLAALEEGEQITYYATDYKINLNNGELGISVDQGRDLLNEIIEEFRNDFERKFIRQSIILDYTGADYDLVDYVDIADIMETQIGLVESVIRQKYEQNPTFTSPTLGVGFNDILVRNELVSRIEVDQINSRTNTYLLSKDVDYLITKYNYSIEVKTFDKETLELQEVEAKNLVDNYTGSVQTILIPGMDPSQVLEVDSYYDTLLENLITIQNQIAEYEKDIEYLELQVQRLEGNDPTFQVTLQQQAEEVVKVETAIVNANYKLERIVEDGNIILAEYNEFVTSNIIKALMTPQYESSVSVLLVTAVSLFIGTGSGVLLVLFKHDWN